MRHHGLGSRIFEVRTSSSSLSSVCNVGLSTPLSSPVNYGMNLKTEGIVELSVEPRLVSQVRFARNENLVAFLVQ